MLKYEKNSYFESLLKLQTKNFYLILDSIFWARKNHS